VKYTIILLLLITSVVGFSSKLQTTAVVYRANDADSLMIWEKLNIQCDPKINELLRQQADQSRKSNTMSGFRLQLFFGSGENAHQQAVRIKTEFLSSYPDVKTYLFFKSPDFIVRVGNFRTKSEALKMQKSLLFKFPNAFIVAEEIALPDLLNLTTIN
jgi:hypothetical protein